MPENPLLIAAAVLAAISLAAYATAFLLRLRASRERGETTSQSQAAELSAMVERQFSQSREAQTAELTRMGDDVARLVDQMAQLRAESARGVEALRAENASSLERVRTDVASALDATRQENARSLEQLRHENSQALDAMRATVDEKLERTLNERLAQSFKRVDERLMQVDRGLGEMQGLAAGVGDLKRVLSNVKTRGILGEVQLGAILSDVLAPSQYAENVATVPGSAERVEFAVRMPGEGDETVWLPIDAKFPGDTYERLRTASEAGDAQAVDAAWKALEARLRTEARDIHDKYVAPPATTSFGIMFLPFEGLYAEVASRPGLLGRLQREWRVNVAGPSTMAALLNSLQMGFQAVAIQRRADEIQRVLTGVKTEFSSYQAMLLRAQRQLGTASRTIDSLVGTRTRAMERQLAGVTELDEGGDVPRDAGTLWGRDATRDEGEGSPRDAGVLRDGEGASPDAAGTALPVARGAHFADRPGLAGTDAAASSEEE